MTSKKTTTDQAIDFERCVELIAESEIVARLDLGHSFLYRLNHPALGAIVVLNSSLGCGALIVL